MNLCLHVCDSACVPDSRSKSFEQVQVHTALLQCILPHDANLHLRGKEGLIIPACCKFLQLSMERPKAQMPELLSQYPIEHTMYLPRTDSTATIVN